MGKKPLFLSKETRQRMYYYRGVYIIAIPALLYLLIFKYLPMIGNYIALTDFNPMKGIFGSDFVGLKHFIRLFRYPDILLRLLANTFIISGMRLLFAFPVPIVLAILLNEKRNQFSKRVYQTVLYVPHFISLVVVASITHLILDPGSGIINYLIIQMGGKPIAFLLKKEYFRWIIVIQGIWMHSGWGTIIYLAALSGIDQNLYDAAAVDGVGRFGRIIHVSLPGIMNTIIILLILRIGKLINENFQQIFLMLNPSTYEVGHVFETYVFRFGIELGQVSFAAAIGLFKAIVAVIMVNGANTIARKFKYAGVY